MFKLLGLLILAVLFFIFLLVIFVFSGIFRILNIGAQNVEDTWKNISGKPEKKNKQKGFPSPDVEDVDYVEVK